MILLFCCFWQSLNLAGGFSQFPSNRRKKCEQVQTQTRTSTVQTAIFVWDSVGWGLQGVCKTVTMTITRWAQVELQLTSCNSEIWGRLAGIKKLLWSRTLSTYRRHDEPWLSLRCLPSSSAKKWRKLEFHWCLRKINNEGDLLGAWLYHSWGEFADYI